MSEKPRVFLGHEASWIAAIWVALGWQIASIEGKLRGAFRYSSSGDAAPEPVDFLDSKIEYNIVAPMRGLNVTS